MFGPVAGSTSHCHWPSKARDALLSLHYRAWFQEFRQTVTKKTKPLPIPLSLVRCGRTGQVLTPANDNHPKYMGPHLQDRNMALEVGAKYYYTGVACIHGHMAPRSASDGKCTVCKWLQWEANRRKKGKKPFEPNWKKADAQELGDKFFHGDTCPHGHSGMRWTHNGACVECTINAARKFQNTPEGIKARKQWRFDNPDKVREYNRNSKAKRKGAEGTHTAQDIRDILTRQKYKCVECGVSVRKKSNRHVDHIMPIALGGTNWPFNLQVLCPSCNLSKNAKHPLEWAREKGRLV